MAGLSGYLGKKKPQNLSTGSPFFFIPKYNYHLTFVKYVSCFVTHNCQIDLLISVLICCLQFSKIDSKISFCIVFDVPLKSVAVSKCDLKLESKFDVKSSKPRKTPGLVESTRSS